MRLGVRLAWAAIAVLAVVLAAIGAPAAAGVSAPPHGPAPAAGNNVVYTTLTLNYSDTNDLSSTFWGTTVTPHARLLNNEADLLNATPTEMFVYPGAIAGDEYNPLNNTITNTYNGTVSTPLLNESQFISWCEAFTSGNCNAIFQVPGEINNTAEAGAIVNYTEYTLHFFPKYWEIGNEPALWKHYNENWSTWSSTYVAAPTPYQYAELVHNYTLVMKGAFTDPHDPMRVIGLPGIGGGQQQPWVRNMTKINGPEIAGIAVHEYPAGNVTGNETLNQFYATLHGVSSIPSKLPLIAGWIASQEKSDNCGSCNISLFITEIGSALSHHSYGPFASGFPGAIDMAAQMTQAMVIRGLQSVDVFASVLNTTNSWFTFQGQPRPSYILYSQVLNHLGNAAIPVSFNGGKGFEDSMYAIATNATSSGGRADLLVVNANTTYNASFVPRLPGYTLGSGGAVEVWNWTGDVLNNSTAIASTPQPIPYFYAGGFSAGSYYTLPPQSIVLFEEYPSPGGAPVTFHEVGAPVAPTDFWFMDAAGTWTSSNQTNLTLFLPVNSAYSITAPVLTVDASEHYQPFPPAPGTPAAQGNVTIPFNLQWRIELAATPAGDGTISPDVGWANATTPLNVTATAAPGYLFEHWSGWGPGSYTGTNPTATITPAGLLGETASFALGIPVSFDESGLPSGTDWGVTVAGTTQTASNSGPIAFDEPNNHTYAFQVAPVAGYRSVPKNSSVTVADSPVTIDIAFFPRYVPPAEYPVTFAESGLPAGLSWSVTVRNVTVSTTTSALEFLESNNSASGSDRFSVTSPAGYHAVPAHGGFTVNGAAVEIDLSFLPVLYSITWEESGLGANPAWGVLVDSALVSSNSSWAMTRVANGSYQYAIPLLPNYVVTPQSGSVSVDGGNVVVSVTFTHPTYGLTFQAVGLPVGIEWTVSLNTSPSVTTLSSATSDLLFNVTNRTWAFGVGQVSGYRSTPTNSSVLVAGPTIQVVNFTKILSPGGEFEVTFSESGLPSGISWSVTVRGDTQTTTNAVITFREFDGAYHFTVATISGYHTVGTALDFDVDGTPLQVAVDFQQLKYAVKWEETGLGPHPIWAVTVDGTPFASNGTWTVAALPNGSYSFTIASVGGIAPTPAAGSFSVAGVDQTIGVQFIKPLYGVTFEEFGLPAGENWQVRLSNQTLQVDEFSAVFAEPNDTYTFDVTPPAGYYASPSHGNATVRGNDEVVPIHFLPVGPGPTPPIWHLALPAMGAAGVIVLSGLGSGFLARAIWRRSGARP